MRLRVLSTLIAGLRRKIQDGFGLNRKNLTEEPTCEKREDKVADDVVVAIAVHGFSEYEFSTVF